MNYILNPNNVISKACACTRVCNSTQVCQKTIVLTLSENNPLLAQPILNWFPMPATSTRQSRAWYCMGLLLQHPWGKLKLVWTSIMRSLFLLSSMFMHSILWYRYKSCKVDRTPESQPSLFQVHSASCCMFLCSATAPRLGQQSRDGRYSYQVICQ